jgi:hypothetical protein
MKKIWDAGQKAKEKQTYKPNATGRLYPSESNFREPTVSLSWAVTMKGGRS